jgi:Holliday junction resolvase
MRKRGRIDENQPEIVRQLRACGVSVRSTANIGSGFPDIVCGYRGRTYLFEIKQPGKKLTKDEERFHEDWRGHVAVVRNFRDALKEMGAV